MVIKATEELQNYLFNAVGNKRKGMWLSSQGETIKGKDKTQKWETKKG